MTTTSRISGNAANLMSKMLQLLKCRMTNLPSSGIYVKKRYSCKTLLRIMSDVLGMYVSVHTAQVQAPTTYMHLMKSITPCYERQNNGVAPVDSCNLQLLPMPTPVTSCSCTCRQQSSCSYRMLQLCRLQQSPAPTVANSSSSDSYPPSRGSTG